VDEFLSLPLDMSQPMSTKPSLIQLLRLDNTGLLAAVVGLIFAGLYGLQAAFGIMLLSRRMSRSDGIDPQVYTAVVLIGFLVCGIILAYRLFQLNHLRKTSIRVSGVVTAKYYPPGAQFPSVDYLYQVDGTEYTGKSSTNRFHPARGVVVGDSVQLLVQPSKPHEPLLLG
jgi:hypothetical protein